jgi:multicomponent Na+:H+ antiporter subunit D
VSPESAIQAALLLPLGGAVLVLALGRTPNLRDGATVVVTLLTFISTLLLLEPVQRGARPELELWEVLPDVPLAFQVEPLGMLFALLASGLWIVTSIYSFGYMRGHREENQTRFFACFAVAIFAALGVAFARNLFTLFLFYELLTFSTYPLVTHHGTDEARAAGRVYLGILVTTSIALLLLAILWTYRLAGDGEFRPGGILAGRADGTTVVILLALFAFGTGKAALMPFHLWLPRAMVAPTPVSALLHAVAVVKAGVFTILKVVIYIFGLDLLRSTSGASFLAWVAAATMLIAALVALGKDNLKARLAYSTVSQLAYIVLGAALATGSAALGGGMHIAMHAAGKITLFFCAGAIMVATHKTEISEMDGLGRVMPVTMTAFLVASLSIIGLPPLGGAWSKWFLVLGAVEAGDYLLVLVLLAGSLLAAAYLMPVVVRAFFRSAPAGGGGNGEADPDGDERRSSLDEAPLLCVVPLCVTALLCLLLFFFAGEIRDLLLPIVGGAIDG